MVFPYDLQRVRNIHICAKNIFRLKYYRLIWLHIFSVVHTLGGKSEIFTIFTCCALLIKSDETSIAAHLPCQIRRKNRAKSVWGSNRHSSAGFALIFPGGALISPSWNFRTELRDSRRKGDRLYGAETGWEWERKSDRQSRSRFSCGSRRKCAKAVWSVVPSFPSEVLTTHRQPTVQIENHCKRSLVHLLQISNF